MVKHPRLAFCIEQRQKYPETPHIHQTAIVHDCVKLGKDVTVHEYCTIGTQGFGHARQNGEWLHIPQIGGVQIGDRVEIYAGTNIDRGTLQDTTICDGTKIDHHCHIGHNVKIGRNCIIAAGTIIAGSTEIGNDCWIGPGSTIKEHLKIGDKVLIGMASNVLDDIRSNVTVVGNPARILRSGNVYLEEEIHNLEE